MASVSIEVAVVEVAIREVRVVAGLGGFVEQLSASGDPGRQQANMTIRVPEAQFFTALERMETLGEVRSQTLGSEDVSEAVHRPGSEPEELRTRGAESPVSTG